LQGVGARRTVALVLVVPVMPEAVKDNKFAGAVHVFWGSGEAGSSAARGANISDCSVIFVTPAAKRLW
jgi:hypothetical protein